MTSFFFSIGRHSRCSSFSAGSSEPAGVCSLLEGSSRHGGGGANELKSKDCWSCPASYSVSHFSPSPFGAGGGDDEGTGGDQEEDREGEAGDYQSAEEGGLGPPEP